MGFAKGSTHPTSVAALLSLAEIVVRIGGVAGPIRGIDAARHQTMKRGMRPVRDAGDVAMFHRVEMNVVDMPRDIVVVAQRMLPIAPLPDAAFGFARAAFGNPLARRQAA